MATINVSNAQIYATLQLMGFSNADSVPDLTGGQHHEFKARMLKTLGIDDTVFNAAEQMGAAFADPSSPLYQLTDPTAIANYAAGFLPGLTIDADKVTANIQGPNSTVLGTLMPETESPAVTKGAMPPAIVDLPQGPSVPQVAFNKVYQTPGTPAPANPAAAAPAAATPAAAPVKKTSDRNQVPIPAATDFAGKPLPTNATDIRNYIAGNYGFAAMALNDPEINGILDKAARAGLSPDAVKGLVSSSGWWKSHSDAQRQWSNLEQTDPATTKARIAEQVANLSATAVKDGMQVDGQRLQNLAEIGLRNGWSTQQMADGLASEYKYDPSGQTAGLNTQMKGLAHNYAQTLADDTYTKWGQQIASGRSTIEDFTQYLSNSAKSLMPGLGVQLDQGQDVKTLIDPYVQRAAKLLDVSPDSIDFTDPKWMRFVNQVDPKTGNRYMSNLSDMEATIRSDPQYGFDKTKTAMSEATSMTTDLMKRFGKL